MPRVIFHLASCPDMILGDMVEWCMYFILFYFTSLSPLTFVMFAVLALCHYSNFLPFSSSPQDPSMQTRVSTEAVATLYTFAQDTLHMFAEDTFEPKTSISPNSGLPDTLNPLVFKCESLAYLRTKVLSVLDSFVDKISECVCAGALTYPNSSLLNTSHSLINNTFKCEGLVDPSAKSSSVLDSFASNFKSACTDTSTHPNTNILSSFANKAFERVDAGISVLPNSGLLNTSYSLIINTFEHEGLVHPGAKSLGILDLFANNFKGICTDTSTRPNTDVSSPFTNKTKRVGAGASVLPNSEHAGTSTSTHPNTGISIAYNAITNNLFNYLNYLITLV